MALPMLTSRVRWLLPVALALTSCAPSPLQRAARSGNFGRLKTEIASERARGGLDRTEVLESRARSGRNRNTPGPGYGSHRPHRGPEGLHVPLRRHPGVAGPLTGRRRGHGNAGAARRPVERDLVHGSRGARAPVRKLREPAVAGGGRSRNRARGTGRGKFLVDPDERVRLAALRAALEFPTPSAWERCSRRPGSIPPAGAESRGAGGGCGGARKRGALLHDLYAAADEDLRQAIVKRGPRRARRPSAARASSCGWPRRIEVPRGSRPRPSSYGSASSAPGGRRRRRHEGRRPGPRPEVREGIARNRLLPSPRLPS